MTTPDTVKLQKLLAEAGLGSRRAMEAWISDGRVTINGKLAKLGDRAKATDSLAVDGEPLAAPKAIQDRLLMYYKPLGEICTRDDPEGRKTPFDRLPDLNHGRWIMVGRLDINTCGLLLFTNNGTLAHHLMHPSHNVEREYLARVLGEFTDAHRQQLLAGVDLDDGPARCTHIQKQRQSGNANGWLKLTLMEGRQHEVRRLMQAVGLQVNRLIRIRYGDYRLPRELAPKQWQELPFPQQLLTPPKKGTR